MFHSRSNLLGRDFHHSASIFMPFLGPNKSLKWIIEENQVDLFFCALSIFQAASFDGPFDNIIEETLHAHHEQFGYGATSLLAMWYIWKKEFELLIAEGYEVEPIVNVARKTIDYIISLLSSIEIPVHTCLPSLINEIQRQGFGKMTNLNSFSSKNDTSYNPKNHSSVTFVKMRNNDVACGIKLRSRHLTSMLMSPEEKQQSTVNDIMGKGDDIALHQTVSLSKQSLQELRLFSKKISHGTSEITAVLVDAWHQQIKRRRSLRFQVEFLNPISIMGSNLVTLLEGLLFKADELNIESAILENSDKYRLLLVTGDITSNFMHLGFSPTDVIETLKTVEQLSVSDKKQWIEDCKVHLLKLQVSILIVHGTVDASISDFCRTQSILLISRVPWKVLSSLSKVLNVATVAYLLDSNMDNISSNVSVKKWDQSITDHSAYILIDSIVQDENILQTVVLSHPCQSMTKMLEHQFWHMASRMYRATNAKNVLPGGGFTEKWCGEKLTSLADIKKQGGESKIIKHIAKGFSDFYEIISTNRHSIDDDEYPFDNRESKIQSWKSALVLCFYSLQVDADIINGCNQSDSENISKLSRHLGNL